MEGDKLMMNQKMAQRIAASPRPQRGVLDVSTLKSMLERHVRMLLERVTDKGDLESYVLHLERNLNETFTLWARSRANCE